MYTVLCRGLVHYTDLLALLRQIDPPLGFGSKCPDLLAYKRLVRMNMPVDEEGKVGQTASSGGCDYYIWNHTVD